MSCTGNQYGGNCDQTIFLGCSVSNFSANASFGDQSTELTVSLVEDPCVAADGTVKVYYDLNLDRQTTTEKDPGFIGEQIEIEGMPAYFRLGDYEFSGIIQSWEKTNNVSGKIYIVKLTSPVEILDNTKLIIGEYAGPVIPPTNHILPVGQAPNNLINIFGYAESEGKLCPQISQTSPGFYEPGDSGIDGATFGTPAGGFGGSEINKNGMQWYKIQDLFNILVNGSPILTNDFSPHGRLTGKSFNIAALASPWNNGYGLLTRDRTINAQNVAEYFVDLSEIPAVPNYFRFNQSEVTLLEAITRVCQEAGHDFYIELLPIKNALSPSGILKMIKIRTVSRSLPPSPGQVELFANNAKTNGILQGSSSGKEFRNEVNSKFIIGGLKQTLYQAYQSYDPEGDGNPTNPQADDMILPYFGLKDNGDMIVPYLDDEGYWEFETSTNSIESSLDYITFSGFPVRINERELRVSASPEMWSSYIINAQTDTNFFLDNLKNTLSFDTFEQLYHRQIAYRTELFEEDGIILGDQLLFEMAGRDFNALSSTAVALTDPISLGIQQDTQKLYQWVSNFASEYYGKKYSVRVPYSCVVLDSESNQISLSEEPTQDGGWTEMDDVLGIPLNNDELTHFRNSSNKIETIVAYTGVTGLDISEIDIENYAIYNNNLYLRSQVDPEYVYHDATGYEIPRAVIEIPSIITSGEESEVHVVHGLITLANILPTGAPRLSHEAIRKAYESAGNKGIAVEVLPEAYIPDAAAFGMKSNIDTYGPWASLGVVGGIEIDKNDGLVPWEYGGYTNLNNAGFSLANAGTTSMQGGEMGNVSVAGFPSVPLGAELNSLTLLAGKNLVENRSTISGNYAGTFADGSPFSLDYALFDYGFVQSGVNGPTVTNINVNIGDQITTQYSFRTYTPKHGRFARLNAQRLKDVSQNQMKSTRDLRNYVRESSNNKLKNSLALKGSINKGIGQLKQNMDRALRPGTPHEVFVGEMLNWGEGKRTIMSTSTYNELPTELTTGENFEGKSIATLDSIIRPISIKGVGGLPRLISPLTTEEGTASGEDGNPHQLSQVDMNPYINPLSVEPSGFLSRRYATGLYGGEIGHDIDLVSRSSITGTTPSGENLYSSGIPSSGLSMQEVDGSYRYEDDYRSFALRGPLLLHSWGYDTDDNPIPNMMDNADSINSGIYESTGLTGVFMSGFPTRADTWPVAPVDLKLNRQRGVWEAGGLATMIFATTTTSSDLTTQDFEADNVEFDQGSDSSVTGVDSTIQIENTFGWNVTPGLRVSAIKGAGKKNYRATQVQCTT